MGIYEGIRIMEDEHRSLAAVLHALEYLAKPEHFAGKDTKVLWAIIHYLEKYSEKLHHPAEDQFLFSVIKEKTETGKEIIAELESEHAKGEERIASLTRALKTLEAAGENAAQIFDTAVQEYANFYWRHMMQEEKIIFPIAKAVLNTDDWDRLEKGFSANKDPISGGGVVQNMEALLRRIIDIAPPPIGNGR